MSSITKENLLLAGFPSAGLVGAFAISYLVNHLKMQRMGELEFGDVMPSYNISKGKVYGPIQVYKKENVYAIVATIPLNLITANEFIKSVIDFAKEKKVEKILIPRGMEVLGKGAKPQTFALAVNEKSKPLIKHYNLSTILEGTIVGSDAGVISALKKSDVPSILLYTVCRVRFPDTEATLKAIDTLAKILHVKVDTKDIKEKLERMEKQNQQLIKDTKKALLSSEKPASTRRPGIA